MYVRVCEPVQVDLPLWPPMNRIHRARRDVAT